MPIVPGQLDPVAPRPSSVVYQATQGDTLGGAVGKAATELGSAIVGAAGVVAREAGYLNHIDNERYAKDALTAYNQEEINRLYGTKDAPGFYSLQGDTAVRSSESILGGLADYRKKVAEGLADRPASLRMFNSAADASAMATQRGVMAHTNRERLQAASASSEARIRLASQTAAYEGQDNEVALVTQLGVIRAEIQANADLQGFGPDVVEAQFKARASDTLKNVIGLRGVNDAAGASAMLKKYAPIMDQKDVLSIAEHLRPRLISQEADGAINTDWLVATGGSAVTPEQAKDRIHGNESSRRMSPGIYGDDGAAAGPMQVHPEALADVNKRLGTNYTHAELAAKPKIGKEVGDAYFDIQYEAFGDVAKATAAYNAGPKRVRDAVAALGAQWQRGIPEATRGYVSRVMGGSIPTAGLVYPDRATMEAAIVARTDGNPEQRNAQLSRLSQKFTLLDHQVAGERTQLTKEYNDAEIALRSGRDDVIIPGNRIRSAFDAVRADDMVANLEHARVAGQAFKAAQWATPEEATAIRATLAAPGDPAVAAAQAKTLHHFDAAMAARNQALQGENADPAAYVSAHPLVLGSRDTNSTLTSETAMLVAQRQLGVGEYHLRIATNTQVRDIVDTLHNMDPSKADMGGELDKLAQKYGNNWPRLFGELVKKGELSPSYRALAIAPLAARADLQRALKAQYELKDKFEENVPSAQKTPLRNAIDGAFTEFAETTKAGGIEAGSNMKDAVKTLGTFYALQNIDGDKAGKKAYAALVGDKWDMQGVTRTPKGMMNRVQEAGNGLLRSLTPEALSPIAPSSGGQYNLEELRTRTLGLARAGSWVATPDDEGVQLVVPMINGSYQEIRWADGRPVVMEFNRLPPPVAARFILEGNAVVGP